MPLTLLSCHFVHSSTYRFVLYLLIFILYFYVHFHRATRMNSADYAVARCLSVRLSVTRQYSVNTAEHILIFYNQVDPPFYFFRTKLYGNILTGTPLTEVPNARGVWKRDFWPISRFIWQMMQVRATMEGEYETVHKLSNGAIFNDLEQPLTKFSRSRHSLMQNISQTALDTAIVATANRKL